MSRYTGPKRRLSRREGVALFAKDAKSIERKGANPPGMRGIKFRKRFSEYGMQLREKQKAKRLFGLSERQFKNLFDLAAKTRGATGLKLLELLELRLDNVVYRLGFASSRMEARQIVGHGHINVDGKKNNIPSFRVKVDHVVAISPKFVDNTQVKKNLEASSTLPEWLERKATVGKVLRVPNREEMEQIINEQLIVEFYSR
ncbi:30S ribosomal protein S4 [Candidatus Daviesbacteria bacterium]|nr:30S ribosomal protein S4 [Candidatus Daviesbacteria bacterium]